MQARELRIGNLVNVKYDDGNQPEKVKEIKIDAIQYILSTDRQKDLKKGRATPIPITEIWITRLGFYSNMFNWQFGDWRISKIEDRFNVGYNALILVRDIKYVHQLQNLFFAITGTELKLKQ